MEENKISPQIQAILEKFPFLSYGIFDEKPYLGIIQNSDTSLISMYVLEMIPSEELRADFLKKGEEWWWDSNHQVPINILLKGDFVQFRPFLRHFNRKDFELLSGYAVSLQETISKRIRKRQITLIRKTTD